MLIALSSVHGEAQDSSLQGVWQIVEVSYTGPAAHTNRAPQPYLYIFTEKYYSITRVSSDTPRATFKDSSRVTPEEALAIWGPFQSSAGTYTVKGDELRRSPIVAKNPQNQPGRNIGAERFVLAGNRLTITEKTGSDDVPIANPTTWVFRRVE